MATRRGRPPGSIYSGYVEHSVTRSLQPAKKVGAVAGQRMERWSVVDVQGVEVEKQVLAEDRLIEVRGDIGHAARQERASARGMAYPKDIGMAPRLLAECLTPSDEPLWRTLARL